MSICLERHFCAFFVAYIETIWKNLDFFIEIYAVIKSAVHKEEEILWLQRLGNY